MPFVIIFFIVWLNTHRSSPLLSCELPRAGTVSCLFCLSTLCLALYMGQKMLEKKAWTCGQEGLSLNPVTPFASLLGIGKLQPVGLSRLTAYFCK